MEGVDFSVDRARLLPGALSTSSLSTLGGTYVPDSGYVAPLGRTGAAVSGVPELGRAGTPPGLTSLGQYQNRYYPPSVSMHSPGANYTMIGSFMNGGAHSGDALKSVVPDIQQYWNPHGDGYPRYIINNNVYSPYLSYLPATESLSLFAHNSGPTAQPQNSSHVTYHRIYDLHKDPYASAVNQNIASGIYGVPAPPVSSQAIRLSPEQMLPSGVSLSKQENTTRFTSESSKRLSENSKKNPKHDFQEKVVSDGKSNSRDSEKKDVSRKSDSKSDARKESKSVCKTKGQVSASLRTKHVDRKGDKPKADKKEKIPAHHKLENLQKTNVIKPMPSKAEIKFPHVDLPTENIDCSRVATKSVECSQGTPSPCVVSSSSSPVVTTLSTLTVAMSESIVSLASSGSGHSSYQNGTDVSSLSTNAKLPLNVAHTTETFSLPYYHSLFAHSQHGGQTTPENKGTSLQTTASELKQNSPPSTESGECDRRIKTENSANSSPCYREALLKRDSTHGGLGLAGHDCENRNHGLKTEPPISAVQCEISCDNKRSKTRKVDINQNGARPRMGKESPEGETSSSSGLLKKCFANESSNSTVPGVNIIEKSTHELFREKKIDNVKVETKPSKNECKSVNERKPCVESSQSDKNANDSCHRVQSLEGKKYRTSFAVSANEHRKHILSSNKKAAKCVVKSVPKVELSANVNPVDINSDCIDKATEFQEDVHVHTVDDEHKKETVKSAIESVPKSIINDRQLNARPGSAPPATLGMKPGDRPEKSPEKPSVDDIPGSTNKDEPSTGGAMNIPVGIAVARQRQGLNKNNSDSRNGSDSAASEDEAADRSHDDSQYAQEAKDREEFLRQQKSLLASTKALTSGSGPDIRNELPANLILTGSANGTGVPWQDDPTARHFASQWLQSPHMNPTSWIGPNPYAMNSTIPSSGAIEPGNIPYTVPKLAQDPLTGQIFLLPATNLEMFDPNRLWSGFPAGSQVPQGHHSPFQSLMATQQTTQVHQHVIQTQQAAIQPQVIPQDRQTGVDFALMMQQYQHLQQLNPPRLDSAGRGEDEPQSDSTVNSNSVQTTPNPGSVDSTQEKAIPSMETQTEQAHGDKDKILSVQPNTFLADMQLPSGQTFSYPYTSAQLPFMYNSGYLPLPGMPVAVADTTTIKSENSLVQSRGTSPMAVSGVAPSPGEDTKPVVASPNSLQCDVVCHGEAKVISNTNDDNSIEAKNSGEFEIERTESNMLGATDDENSRVSSCKHETSGSVESICHASDATERILEDTELKHEVESENGNPSVVCPDNGVGYTESGDGETESRSDSYGDGITQNSEQEVSETVNADDIVDENKDDEDDFAVVKETSEKSVEICSFQNNYNPYTDPLILQAADGLELLSALAEQRTKCPNVESQISNEPEHNTLNIAKEKEKEKDKEKDKEKEKTHEKTKTVKVKRRRTNSEKSQISLHKKENKENKVTESFMTAAGDRIPLDLDSFLQLGSDAMDAMELDMRLRLAELQRRYKEKQRELARLHPRKDKDKDKDLKEEDKLTSKRGPGRPRKRHMTLNSDSSPSKSKCNGKEPPVKKKKLAEELVDRVFRKTGRALQMPLSKKTNSITTFSVFKKSNTCKAEGSRSQKPPTKENSSSSDSGSGSMPPEKPNIKKKKRKADAPMFQDMNQKKKINSKKSIWGIDRKGKIAMDAKDKKRTKKLPKESMVETSNTSSNMGRSLESGIGLLAKFAANAAAALTNTEEAHKKKKRKITEEDSDVDTSDTVVSSSNQKRKPGRPKKRNPSKSQGRTETIVAKKSKNFGLMRLQEIEKVVAKRTNQNSERKIKLDGQTPLKPLYLDEEWTLRRSERIFLSEPSPQPSPNFTPLLPRPVSTQPQQSSAKSKSEKAKLQKAKNIQELSQKVKRKYSKNFNRKSSLSNTSELVKQRAVKPKIKYSNVYTDTDSDSDFSSEGDNVPLSLLRSRPITPEPRSCVINKDELRDNLRVLLFMEPEGLFYEGEVKEIRPPDVYGVVIDNQRGNRPHIYPQEEILKLAVLDVKPGSGRYLPEGTRICAYWSQQFSCLYPGTISKASPNPHVDKNFVNVEFDDGDTGKIPLDHIRMLPQDFPIVSYDPSPLLLLGMRRRHTTSESIDGRKSISEAPMLASPPPKSKRGPGRPPKIEKDRRMQDRNGKSDEFPDEVFHYESVGSQYQRDSGNCKSVQVADWEHPARYQQEQHNGNSSYSKDFKYKGYSKMKQGSHRNYGVNKNRAGDIKSNPLIRASAFDVKKFGLTSKVRSRQNDANDSDSSDDFSDSSNDSDGVCDGTTGNHGGFSNNSARKDKTNRSRSPKSEKKHSPSKCTNQESPSRPKTKGGSSESTENKTIVSAFLPARQLWIWSGKSTKRPGLKGKAKKEFYKSIVRGNETITIGDCAVFLSTGRPNLPYVGRIESLWEGWGGQMVVRVKWFYHPEETKGGNRVLNVRGALFQSPHEDENDVQTISHKCQVLSCAEYKRYSAEAIRKGFGSLDDSDDVYYLAGTYEPTLELIKFEPGVL